MPLQKMRMIVFDFDGVILDSVNPLFSHLDGLRRSLHALGREFPDDAFFRMEWGKGTTDFLNRSFEEKLRNALLAIIRYEEEHLAQSPRYCSLAPTLAIDTLRNSGIATGILTNRSFNSLFKHTKKSGFFADRFDIIVSIGSELVVIPERRYAITPHHKPDGRSFDPIIAHAASRGIDKNEILFVGDAHADLCAARSAGIRFVGVLTGVLNKREYWRELGLSDKDIINSIDDLPKLLGIDHQTK